MRRFWMLLSVVLLTLCLSVGCTDLTGSPAATNPPPESSSSATTEAPTPTDSGSTEATSAPDVSDVPPPSTDQNGFPNAPEDDATKRY